MFFYFVFKSKFGPITDRICSPVISLPCSRSQTLSDLFRSEDPSACPSFRMVGAGLCRRPPSLPDPCEVTVPDLVPWPHASMPSGRFASWEMLTMHTIPQHNTARRKAYVLHRHKDAQHTGVGHLRERSGCRKAQGQFISRTNRADPVCVELSKSERKWHLVHFCDLFKVSQSCKEL